MLFFQSVNMHAMCHALIKRRPSVLCHPVEDHLGLTLTVELEPPWRELLRWIKLIVTVSNRTSTEHLYFFSLFFSIVTEANFILSNFFRFPNLVVSRRVGFDNSLSSVISNYFSLMSLVTNLHKFLNQQHKLLIWGRGLSGFANFIDECSQCDFSLPHSCFLDVMQRSRCVTSKKRLRGKLVWLLLHKFWSHFGIFGVKYHNEKSHFQTFQHVVLACIHYHDGYTK